MKKGNNPRVRKLDPEEPEARDEGPRLLPLDGVERRHSFGPATELGDVALRPKALAAAERKRTDRQLRNSGER